MLADIYSRNNVEKCPNSIHFKIEKRLHESDMQCLNEKLLEITSNRSVIAESIGRASMKAKEKLNC